MEKCRTITLAGKEHIDEILTLLSKYHKDNLSEEEKKEGFVTAKMSQESMLAQLDQGNQIVIAQEGDQIKGVIMAGPWQAWLSIPFFQTMAGELGSNRLDGQELTIENSCLYGPSCLDVSIRGTGAFGEMFAASLEAVKDQYQYMIAFIDKNNPRSYAAHTRKTPLKITGEFSFGGNDYFILACETHN